MKKSTRLFISGSIHDMFFKQFIKQNADKNEVKGFLRKLEDGRIEIFIEGDEENVDTMTSICQRGPPHANIRQFQQQEEKFQDFKEFKIFNF